MKRIIDGITYNTETATLIMDNEGYRLYVTARGKYFVTSSEENEPVTGVLGKGHPLLEILEDVNEYLSMIVMDPWEFEHFTGYDPLTTDAFSEVRVTIRISKWVADKIKAKAKEKGQSVNSFISDVLQIEGM